ncbi:MAG TPA: DoxX family protein [Stellaceae bacterium]|nr:DoxX family protein [Stellaceae bacterium]
MFSRSHDDTLESSSLALWIGRGLSGIFALFMALDTAIKLLQLKVVEQSMAALGYPPGMGLPIGGIEAILLVLYLVRRTSVLGAVLFMAIFGGAIASHLRAGDPLLTHVLFGVYLGCFAWGGLWLRDPALRAVFPLRRRERA